MTKIERLRKFVLETCRGMQDHYDPRVTLGDLRAMFRAIDERDAAIEDAQDALRDAFVLLDPLCAEQAEDDRVGALKVELPDPDGVHPRRYLTDAAPEIRARIGRLIAQTKGTA